MPVIILIVVIFLVALFILGVRFRRQSVRNQLKASEFKSEWISILRKNIALYNKLPESLRLRLHGLINVFLNEKAFSGYNGLEINDEIRVTIAAQACILLLNRESDFYPSLHNIYVYPGAFKSLQTTSDGLLHSVEETVRSGESWHRGHVVLSWSHSRQGGKDDDDGENVVYHEFAHQLDHADGAIDGTPILDSAEHYDSWSKIFSQEYAQLRDKIRNNKKSLIDEYAAVSEGEFFAVVTELFFEQPILFIKEHPELYAELQKFYRLNPAEWFQ